MTLPVSEESHPLLGSTPNDANAIPLSPMRTMPSTSETSETLLDIPLLIAATASKTSDKEEASGSASKVTTTAFAIPTFTVTINPLESNEMTYVPDSPEAKEASAMSSAKKSEAAKSKPGGGIPKRGDLSLNLTQGVTSSPHPDYTRASPIANMTMIVDDEVNKNKTNKQNSLLIHGGQVLVGIQKKIIDIRILSLHVATEQFTSLL